MRMLNSFLLCEEIEVPTTTALGFQTQNDERVKIVKVAESSEEDVPVGSLIKIMSTAGLVDNDHLIIKRSDIIYVV